MIAAVVMSLSVFEGHSLYRKYLQIVFFHVFAVRHAVLHPQSFLLLSAWINGKVYLALVKYIDIHSVIFFVWCALNTFQCFDG